MKILITGANGMVARSAAAYCRELGDEVVALTRDEMDIGDKNAVDAALAEHAPEAVFNCAAFTDVDGSESNESRAHAANAIMAALSPVCAGAAARNFAPERKATRSNALRSVRLFATPPDNPTLLNGPPAPDPRSKAARAFLTSASMTACW